MIKVEHGFTEISGDTDEIIGDVAVMLTSVEELFTMETSKSMARLMVGTAISAYQNGDVVKREKSQNAETFKEIMTDLLKEVHELSDELLKMVGGFK